MKVGVVVPLVGRGEGCVWEETGGGLPRRFAV